MSLVLVNLNDSTGGNFVLLPSVSQDKRSLGDVPGFPVATSRTSTRAMKKRHRSTSPLLPMVGGGVGQGIPEDVRIALSTSTPSSASSAVIRNFVVNTYPALSFGRHTIYKGTPFRFRHYAASRHHFSIASIPAADAPKFRGTDRPLCMDGSTAAGSRQQGAHHDQCDLLVFNWSTNATYVNDIPVPPCGQGALKLLEHDVISILHSSFDPVAGVLEWTTTTAEAGDAPFRFRAGIHGHTSSSNVGDDFDEFESPLRKGTSARCPQPLPLLCLRRREKSPEATCHRKRPALE